MSKWTKAKKQAKREARKSAKKMSRSGSHPPKKYSDARKNAKTGKLTGRRNVGDWHGDLRYMPVQFVKSTEEVDFEPPNKLCSVSDSDSGSDDRSYSDELISEEQGHEANGDTAEAEMDTVNFDEGMDSWLVQELGLSEDELEVEQDTINVHGLTSPDAPSLSKDQPDTDHSLDGNNVIDDANMADDVEDHSIRDSGMDIFDHSAETQEENMGSLDDSSSGIAVLSDLESEVPDFEPDLNVNDHIIDFSSDDSDGNENDSSEDDEDSEVSAPGSDADGQEDLSSDESLKITLDDLDDESDDSDGAVQDYLDNMSDLDDDQIFALAANQSVHQNEDIDLLDAKLDERDEYFDELLGSGIDPSQQYMQSKSQNKQKTKERNQMKELRKAAKNGHMQLLWMKYPHSISISEVVAELTTYVKLRKFNPKPLVFPPLDTNANWYVKQFADHFNLTSKVAGSRDTKTVVVTLTNRSSTRPISGKIGSLLKRRQHFPRKDADSLSPELAAALQYVVVKSSTSSSMDSDGEKVSKKMYTMDRQKLADKVTQKIMSGVVPDFVMASSRASDWRGKGTKPTSSRVRDGHIVGQHATAIQNDNFGHKLMRQMGWTEGSGLGKERAGIVAPVPATVKLTRGGLGA